MWKFWCRLCARDAQHGNNEVTNNTKIALDAVIQQYCPLEDFKQDEAPQNICLHCEAVFNKFHSYVQYCQKVQQLLFTLNGSSSDQLLSERNKLINEFFNKACTSEEPLFINAIHCVETSACDNTAGNDIYHTKSCAAQDSVPTDNSSALHSGKIYKRKKSISVEVRHKTKTELQNCNISLNIKSQNELTQAITQNNPISEPGYCMNFICRVCQEDCQNWHALSRHTQAAHGERARVLCVCGKYLASRMTINAHNAKHNLLNSSHRCATCGSGFMSAKALQQHMLGHEMKRDRPFVCSRCARTFTSAPLLRHHERLHQPLAERAVFKCDHCQLNFATKYGVTKHIRVVHERRKPFVCEECGRSFATKGIMNEHMVLHSDEQPFQCPDCPKRFKSRQRLGLHADTHGSARYICPRCSLALGSRRTLRDHMAVHVEPRHACPLCHKTFRRTKDLRSHSVQHTGERPFQCGACPRTFANSSNCRAHHRRAHPSTSTPGNPAMEQNNTVCEVSLNSPKHSEAKLETK